jgi:RNA polymerase sigma factor (sigma-70 family)
MSSVAVTICYERFYDGDRDAADGLMRFFYPKMLAVARRLLSQWPLAVLDGADVAQSAFATFCKRVEGGEFRRGLRRDELWRLLAKITIRRARRRIRKELADKRRRPDLLDEAMLSLRFDDATLAEVARQKGFDDLDLFCQELLDRLGDDELRQIALWRLMGYSNREIADMKGCSERTIERKLELIRAIWDQDHDASDHDA